MDTSTDTISSSKVLSPESNFAMKSMNVTIDSAHHVLPPTVKRSDIGVTVLVSLESVKPTTTNIPNAEEKEKSMSLANQIQTIAMETLRQEFTGNPKACQYLLKVYVVLACQPSTLHKLTFGLVGEAQQECLEWFLEDQHSEIIKAGRVGTSSGSSTGPPWKNDASLHGTTQELCHQIVRKLGLVE